MIVLEIYIFVLSAFTGYMVISRVPQRLHTPLMAATNAISGISLVGFGDHGGRAVQPPGHAARLHSGHLCHDEHRRWILIADRMLRMFQRTTRAAGSGEREEDERRKGIGRRATDIPT